jgi:hypothetical protein
MTAEHGPWIGPVRAWRWRAHVDICENECRGCFAGRLYRAGGYGLSLGVGCTHVRTGYQMRRAQTGPGAVQSVILSNAFSTILPKAS